MRKIEAGVERCTWCALETVIGPECLGAVGCFNYVRKGLLAVCAGKGNMAGRVPVFRAKHVFKTASEGIDSRD